MLVLQHPGMGPNGLIRLMVCGGNTRGLPHKLLPAICFGDTLDPHSLKTCHFTVALEVLLDLLDHLRFCLASREAFSFHQLNRVVAICMLFFPSALDLGFGCCNLRVRGDIL